MFVGIGIVYTFRKAVFMKYDLMQLHICFSATMRKRESISVTVNRVPVGVLNLNCRLQIMKKLC